MNFARSRSRKQTMKIPRLPLVAFIDVVLFLLLYFVFASDLNPGEAQLPTALKADAGKGGTASRLSPQIVRVENKDGKASFRIGDREVATGDALRQLLAQLPKEAGVVIRVSGAASVDAAAVAVSAARQAGYIKVSYVPGA